MSDVTLPDGKSQIFGREALKERVRTLLGAASADRTAKLWNVSAGKELGVFSGHGQSVTSKLQEAENQIITDYEVYGRRPNDADLLIVAGAALRIWSVEADFKINWRISSLVSIHSKMACRPKNPVLRHSRQPTDL